jgi:MFS family permease
MSGIAEGFPESTRDTRRLAFIFGALYFVQGVAEPTGGLISQPVRSLLKDWGKTPAEVGAFIALVSIPWMIKPIYGLLSDFVPLFGSRRRNWLILWTAVTSVALTILWLFSPRDEAATMLMLLLLIPTIGIAFTDVVVDALMVEEGQPRGITGTLQSVQWGCISAAAILTGWLGGYLSENKMQSVCFIICAVTALGSFIVAIVMVREPPTKRPEGTLKDAVIEMKNAAMHPAVLGVGVFLFLVNFSPFGSSVRYMHMTDHLSLTETMYGKMGSVEAIAAVAAAATYGWICRRFAFKTLVHMCIAGAVLCTLAWWFLADARTAYIIAIFYGYGIMVVGLVQLDMAARYCPPAVAATVFALLMSLINQAAALSEWVGGVLYTRWSEMWGVDNAFDALVLAGGACTALCWLVVPWLNRIAESQGSEA